MTNSKVRIYGPSVNNDSWSRVAAGMASGLTAIGRLAGCFFLEDAVRSTDDGLADGHDAEVGVLIGPPSFANVLRGRGNHERRAVMIAANSSWLPGPDVKTVDRVATDLLAPSEYSADVIRSHASLPVSVWQHGVADAYRPMEGTYLRRSSSSDTTYRVLHMASTIRQRKGTEQIVRAWARMHRRGIFHPGVKPELHVVLSGPASDLAAALREEADGLEAIERSVVLAARLNLNEQQTAALYQQYDLVCQPSRAEGFGLVPLEARSCGVPVCATGCTGHADHMDSATKGVVIVASGNDAPIDDGPGAMAPSVQVEDVYESLVKSYASRDRLKSEAFAAAAEVRQRWSWERVCRDWVERNL
jgi:glycosyltransferase involved in cell wall biosynthesis